MSEILLLALDSLRANKLRSFLTILGVVIGVATVIGMSSIISGLNANISSQIQDLGSNLVFIQRIPPTIGGRVPPEMFSRKKLTLDDANAIAQLPLVQAISPILQYVNFSGSSTSFAVRYRDHTAKNTIFIGATPDVANVMNLHMASGRWINQADYTHSSSVVVLGHDTADTIFPANVDPVDKYVEIDGQPFRVIGVLEKRKDTLQGGSNPNDNVAEFPIGTFWRLHPEHKDFMFVAKVVAQEDMPRAISQIEGLLRLRRGVPPNKDDDFAITTQDTFTDLWNQISSGVFTVMLTISSIALIVGGVGTASEWRSLIASENSADKMINSAIADRSDSPTYNVNVKGQASGSGFPIVIGANGQPVVTADISKLPGANAVAPFVLTLNEDGFGPSDHSSFYGKQIPVLFFWTGTHDDYHKPSDTADKINYEGEARIVVFVERIIRDIDNKDKRPTYTLAKSDPQQRTGFRVYLGTIPNYADSNDGLKLDGVRDDSPAAKAGLKAGDKVVKLAGREIKNVYDYTYALGEMKAGQEYEVEVMRDGKRLTLKLIPEGRK